MTPRKSVVFIPSDATDEEIINTIAEEGYSRLPVYEEKKDNIVGILYARDYLLKRGTPGFTMEQVLFQPTFVPESAHLDALFADMQKAHNHIVVVVNEYGETAGIVTMEDILEEIVGDIWDERDEAIENFVQLSEDTYRVLCAASIEDFFEFFSLEPDEETESTTINGFIMELSGNIPEVGYVLEYKNLTISVTSADDLMTHEVQVKVHPIEENDQTDTNE